MDAEFWQEIEVALLDINHRIMKRQRSIPPPAAHRTDMYPLDLSEHISVVRARRNAAIIRE